MKRRSFLALLGLAPAATISAKSVTADAAKASSKFRMSAHAGPSGDLLYTVEGRSNVDADFRSSGMFVEVPVDPDAPTRVIVNADNFVITDDAVVVYGSHDHS